MVSLGIYPAVLCSVLLEWNSAGNDAPPKACEWKDAPGSKVLGICTLFSSCCSGLGSVGAPGVQASPCSPLQPS